MIENPFLSKTFQIIWLKHFNDGKAAKTFKFINNVSFVKHKYFSLFTNVGKNITNGMYYSFSNLNENYDYKNKVFLIHDVPEYFKVNSDTGETRLKVKKINQYKGLTANFEGFNSFEEYFNNQFRSKRRNYIKKKKEQLELCFNIEYTILYGEVTKELYQFNMLAYKDLIERRFGAKEIATSSINYWDYYFDLLYEMILNKKALLFIIKKNGKPVCGSFNFISKDILFFSSQTFDVDLFKFGLGHIMIYELGKWCFDNKISILDFSKGDFEYKRRWANKEYHFQVHVLYDTASIKATFLGAFLATYYRFKQFLRDKKVNRFVSKSSYYIKNIGKKNIDTIKIYNIEFLKDTFNADGYKQIDISHKYAILDPVIIEILSNHPEPEDNLKIYSKEDNNKIFVILGNKSKCRVLFD